VKIYFTASAKYKDKRKKVYQRIVSYLQKESHEVFEKVLSTHLPDVSRISAREIKAWHQKWSAYIRECDLVIFEGSYPSTIHIGFELGLILAKGKPTVLLFQEGKDPTLISQIYSNRLVKSEYTEDNLEEVIAWCLEEVEKISHRRFTFYISPEIDEFLDRVSDKKTISRSKYIRALIEKEMEG